MKEKPKNKPPTTVELLVGEIIYEASLAGLVDGQIQSLDLLTNWLAATHAALAENIQKIEAWKISGAMESDVRLLDDLIKKIVCDLLPAAEIAVEKARRGIYDLLEPAIFKVKLKYQTFFNEIFSEVTSVIISLAYHRPKTAKLN